MKKDFFKIRRKATTLIEVLLYSLLVSGFLLVVSYFAMNAIGNKSRNDASAEVNDNALIITEEVSAAVRNAKELQSPAIAGQIDSTLTIVTASGGEKSYSLTDGRLQVSENGGAPVNMTSTNIIVSNLAFTNLTSPSTEGNVRIQMNLAFRNPGGAGEYNSNIRIDTAASLRSNN